MILSENSSHSLNTVINIWSTDRAMEKHLLMHSMLLIRNVQMLVIFRGGHTGMDYFKLQWLLSRGIRPTQVATVLSD